MKVGIRTKIVLLLGATICIMLFLYTVHYLRALKEQYLHAVTWQADSLSQGLSFRIQEMDFSDNDAEEALLSQTEMLSASCKRLYDKVESDKNLTHIRLLSGTGTVVAHNDSSAVGQKVEEQEVLSRLGNYRTNIVFDDASNSYHTLVPVFDFDMAYLGAVDVGFSGEEVDRVMGKFRSASIWLFVVSLFISCLVVFLSVDLVVTRPIKYLAKVGTRLADGYPIHSLQSVQRGDEIALLSSVFVNISNYISEITGIAENVATGALAHDVRKRSKRDALGVALQEMLSYLQTLAGIASGIAGGDLTVVPSLRSDADDFGRSMREMTSGLQSLIQQIRDSSEQISSTGANLGDLSHTDMAIVQSTQNSIEKMISTMTEMGNSVEEVAHNMDMLSSSVEETSASVSNMTKSISNIAVSTGDLSEQTDKAIVELNKSTELLGEVTEKTAVSRELSQETIEDALQGQQAVEEVTASMDTIQQTNSSTVETITRFEQQTQDIGTILDVIDEITDQSSLLALNASIIAAQAGSHGRGFAVIADEMRNLATKVSSSTKDIAAIVKVVQEETQTVVKKIHEGTEDIAQGVRRTQQARGVLQKIFNSAQRSSAVVTEISNAIQKMQETTSRQMKNVMGRVSSMTAEITEATMEQKAGTIQIDQTIEYINHMAAQTQNATTEQLQGVRQVLEVVDQVRQLSVQNLQSSGHIEKTASELSAQAQILLQSVDRFKLGHSEMIHSAIEEPAEKSLAQGRETAERQALIGK